MSEQKNWNYITVLSVISAFSVISLHTNGVFWSFSRARYWFTANLIECIYYFAVPVFFMISGATLMDFGERYGIRTYFLKRIRKTVFPFLFWSFVGLLFQLICLKGIKISQLSPSFIWNGIVGTSFVGIYWFFIPLFLCYASLPLFAAVPREKRRPLFSYLAVAAFIMNSLVPFLIQVFHLSIKWPFHMEAMGGYLFYLVVGYLLHTIKIEKPKRQVIYILAIVGLLLHICGTYILSMEAGKIIKTYKDYLNVPCIFYSIGVFVFFKENADKIIQKIGGVFAFLKNYTFAIYLLHWFVMMSLVRICHIDTHSIVYRLFSPFLIAGVCILLTYLARKFSWGKRILP